MKPSELIEILGVAAKLKTNTRHCWTDPKRKESVADHSWRLALFAMILSSEEAFQDIDMNKVIRMCLIHDLGEAFTGDIPTFLKKNEDAMKEDQILLAWVESLSEPLSSQWKALLEEMNAMETKEAQIYKALDKLEALISHNESDISTWLELDKLEALISHNESDISTWLDLEYDLQLTYGVENMKCMPYFIELRKAVDAWTNEKILASRTNDKTGE